jgi:hypothetical protein
LVRFAGDLDWLKQHGVEVEQYNLSSHPAAFVQQEAVREALKYEGNNCLPLIVVNGSIVSRCVYPSRVELKAFMGITGEAKNEAPEVLGAPTSPIYPKSETAACGPGCDCEAPPRRRTMKVAVSLIVLLAAGSILAYKAMNNNSDASNAIDANAASAFNVAPTTPKPMPRANAQSSDVAVQKMAERRSVPDDKPMSRSKAQTSDVAVQKMAERRSVPDDKPMSRSKAQTSDVAVQKMAERRSVPKDEPMVKKANAVESPQAGQKIGENLESINDLNKVAMDQDAVFIYVPGRDDVLASDETNAAVLAAQKILKSNDKKIGLYTLPTSSSDYASVSVQVRPPAILVASKGKGMVVVSGLVTETKLLQAFTASARAGGCGPSGCGPSGCK